MQLTSSDISFVAKTLSSTPQGRAYVQSELESGNLEPLEHPKVREALVGGEGYINCSAKFFFHMGLRPHMQELSIADHVAEYVSDISAKHSNINNLEKVKKFTHAIDFALAAEGSDERWFFYQELGNRALFLTGYFPSFTESRHQNGKDYWTNMGIVGFEIAAQTPTLKEYQFLFENLASEFRSIQEGMHRFRMESMN